MHSFSVILKQIRIHHWIKNFLVFAPLFFAGQLTNIENLTTTLQLFFAFSFLASSVYIINDIADREKDRQHPVKKNRPIASGAISITQAWVILAVLVIGATILSRSFPLTTNLILLAYAISNILYATYLKHIPLIEIFLVASMYLMRITAGGELMDIYISPWLIIVTFLLALFLIVGKRRAELKATYQTEKTTRKVLAEYNENFLDHVLTVVITGVILSYTLYTVDANRPYLIYTSFFVFFGMFRYLYVVHKFNKGEAPERMIFHDSWLFASVIGWLLFMLGIFYFA
jgi:decaprenyl-phosphate phosphoribosyltransferase